MLFQNNIFYIKVEDYSVSNEVFDLHHNTAYDLLITFPKPSLETLPNYYESDDYISHTDKSRTLFERVYQIIKSIAIKKKISLINKHSNKGALLDIGAGTGSFLYAAKKDGWQTIGLEPSEKAKQFASQKGLEFVDNLNDIPSQSQDIVTMWHVLEHVPNLEDYLFELKRIIKPTGTIFIAVPNFKSFDASYYGKFWAAYDVPRHLWHFSKGSIQKLFSEKQMRLEAVLPMKFDSYYVSLLSEKNRNGKIKPLRAFFVGLKSNYEAKQTKEYSSHIYVIKNE